MYNTIYVFFNYTFWKTNSLEDALAQYYYYYYSLSNIAHSFEINCSYIYIFVVDISFHIYGYRCGAECVLEI